MDGCGGEARQRFFLTPSSVMVFEPEHLAKLIEGATCSLFRTRNFLQP